MKCPVCPETQLVMSDRQGIEIDYCPQCRGVWLDRGELDKIIERAAPTSSGAAPSMLESPAVVPPIHTWNSSQTAPPRPRDDYPRRDEYERRDDDDDHYDKRYKKKKRGFLGEIFDFD